MNNSNLKSYIDSIIFENEDEQDYTNLLVPKRSKEERDKNHLRITYKKIHQYIKDGMQGDLNLNEAPIEIFDSKELTRVGGLLSMDSCENLKKFNPQNLKSVDRDLSLYYCVNLIEIDCPKLENINGDFHIHRCRNLSLLNIPSLKYIGGNFSISWNTRLEESIPENLKIIGGNFYAYNTIYARIFDHSKSNFRKYLLKHHGLTIKGYVYL